MLKSSTHKCAREMLAHYENFTLECECVLSTQTRECKLALNLYRTMHMNNLKVMNLKGEYGSTIAIKSKETRWKSCNCQHYLICLIVS